MRSWPCALKRKKKAFLVAAHLCEVPHKKLVVEGRGHDGALWCQAVERELNLACPAAGKNGGGREGNRKAERKVGRVNGERCLGCACGYKRKPTTV